MSEKENYIIGSKSTIEAINYRGWIASDDCFRLALSAYFDDHDLDKMRLYSYLEGRFLEMQCLNTNLFPNNRVQALPIDYHLHFSIAMLSDCLPMLKRMQALRYNNREKEFKQGWIFAYGMQCILNDDWQEIERIQAIAQRFPKKGKSKYQLILDIWEAMKLNSIDKTRLSIQQLVKPVHHRNFNDWDNLSQLISTPALGYAKLAWIRGMQIDFNSRLIPQDMLPFQPLPFYDDEHDYIKIIRKQWDESNHPVYSDPFHYLR